MHWIRVSRGVPAYSGRLRAPASYAAWTRGAGADLVAADAARRRFTIVGRRRAACNALWAELRHAAERGTLAGHIQQSVQHFVLAPGEIAAAPVNLPRAFVEGRRLVAVPRVTCVARGFNLTARDLDAHPAIAGLAGGAALRDFFYGELVSAIDASLIEAGSAMRRPMPTADGWYVVGFEPATSWLIPVMGGPERRGHFYVYEAPRAPVKRWPFASLASRMREIGAATGALSRVARDEILRSARYLTNASPTVLQPLPLAASE